jgi:ATP-dependent DNA helicase RecQ
MKERFGLSMVSKVLKGSKSKRVLDLGLNKLSTYGILSSYTEKDIQQLGLILQSEGYIESYTSSMNNLPLIRLTEKAIKVIKGEQNVYLRPIQAAAPSNWDKNTVQTRRSILLDQLMDLRRQFSNEEKLPPYMILSDSTLREIVDLIPLNKTELLSVVGMAQRKYDKYGERILNVTAAFTDEREKPREKTMVKPKNTSNSHITTYELFQDGKSINEIASIRSLSVQTIEDHLIKCHSEGFTINWDKLILEKYKDIIIKKIHELGASKLKPLKEALPDDVSYFQIKAVIASEQLTTRSIS